MHDVIHPNGSRYIPNEPDEPAPASAYDPDRDGWGDELPAPPTDLVATSPTDTGDDRPPDEPGSFLDRLEASALTTAGLRSLPTPESLIDGLLVKNSTVLIYGASGARKTFFTMGLGLHIVTGNWWHGREVTKGPGVYILAEGAYGSAPRVDAWAKHNQVYDLDKHAPITWIPSAVNLANALEAEAFTQFCEQREATWVVVDTFARCAVGVDENSARDVGLVIDNVERLKARTGACIMLVHHSGKDASSGARGSSALRAAVDTEIEVKATDEAVTVKVTKQRNAAELPPFKLTVQSVDDSCVLVPYRTPDGATLTDTSNAILDVLRRIEVPGGVATSVWLKSTTVADSTFYDHRRRLLDLGLVVNIGSDRAPKYLTAERRSSEPESGAES